MTKIKFSKCFIILVALIFFTASRGAEIKNECSPEKVKNTGIKKLKDLDSKMRLQELQTLAKISDDKVIKYFIEPTKKTCSSVEYQFPEVLMNPKDSVYFYVPPALRERGVHFMVLGHRQNPEVGSESTEKDQNPGLSSVQVHQKKSWNYWNGQASGNKGAKFAERRPVAEIENLYDWGHYGYRDTKTEALSKKDLYADAIKVVSVGTDKVFLSQLTLKIAPMKETSNQEIIYSTGTSFNPASEDIKYTLGGGQAFKGKFPKAKVIAPDEEISIPLTAGKKIASIDIACGDSHPDGNGNSDGGFGRQGWAKLSIGIKRADGQIKWLTRNENVPPEGVLMASPDDCDEVIEKGSELILRSEEDQLYIMGLHVGLRD